MEVNLTGVAALALIAGVIVPFVTALFTNPLMTPTKKRIIAGSVSVVLGLVSAIITGQLGWIPTNIVAWVNGFILSVGIVILAAQGFYKQFKGTVENLEFLSTGDTYAPEAEPRLEATIGATEEEDVVEEEETPEGEEG